MESISMVKVTTRFATPKRGTHGSKGASAARLALVAAASVAALGMSAGTASAQFLNLGDAAVSNDSPVFRLNPNTLEPGCFQPGMGKLHHGVDVDSHIDVTQTTKEAHVTVRSGANFSVDQVLVPGVGSGYAVYNDFDTGSNPADVDVDPTQTATDLSAPKGADVDAGRIILCVSDHPDADQNEPYISDGLPGEVAAINRPIIQPTVSALGASAISNLKTYKVGFGYKVTRGYDATWRRAFLGDGVWGPGTSFGDPQAWDADHDGQLDHVIVKSRAEQAGVRRYNDMDEFGEAFNNGAEKSSYGQPIVFDVGGPGDPYAYLHKSLPAVIDGGFAPIDSWLEGEADQTSAAALLTFTAEGDLPISWAVKPSLAPAAYGKKATLTDDMLRAWNTSWQNYYAGKGPKPTLPLAPGTNSPAPDPSITVIVNLPETRPTTAPQTVTPAAPGTSTTTTIITGGATTPATNNSKKVKTAVLSSRLMRTKGSRVVQVFVRSEESAARIQIRMYGANGKKLGEARKMVSTNRFVKVSGLHVAKKVKTVRASIAG
jgi:hypothetical protein